MPYVRQPNLTPQRKPKPVATFDANAAVLFARNVLKSDGKKQVRSVVAKRVRVEPLPPPLQLNA